MNGSPPHTRLGGLSLSPPCIPEAGCAGFGCYSSDRLACSHLSNTQCLLKFQGAGIYDRKGLSNIDTAGNACVDTSEKKYGTGSIKFDGTSDCLDIVPTEQLRLGPNDFTVEFWLNTANSAKTQVFFDMRHDSDTNTSLAVFTSGGLKFYAGTSSVIIGPISNNTWHHIAVVRDRSTIRSFIDGVAGGTEANTNDLTCENFRVGANWGRKAFVDGHIDDLRVTKGIARYTADFTPPPMLLPNTKALLTERRKHMLKTLGRPIQEPPLPNNPPPAEPEIIVEEIASNDAYMGESQ